jgi:TonB-linked SusC/RagA family outer membrane protein
MQKNTAFAMGRDYALCKPKLQAKLLFIMRVSVFCCAMLFTSLQLLAFKVSRAQNINETFVNFGVKNVSLDKALKILHDESGIVFFYPSEKVASYTNISVDAKDRTVESTLELLLANTNLEFKQQNDDVVVIYQKPDAPIVNAKLISGKVVDEAGQPLPGVSIKVKGSNLGLTTNEKGQFAVYISTPDAILQFAYVGYISREIPVEQIVNPAVIVLKSDIGKLDEVQIIAYGTTTKRESTGDVSTISAKTIEQYPTTNVLDALQGNVAGLSITKSTGNANGSYEVLIRGFNGLYGSQPLYVVDGVPYQGGNYNSQNLNLGANTTAGTTGSGYDALSFINPDDIESISVLKDADATSIYGSRGADGVILITTKKGKVGAPKIDASVYTGVNDVGHFEPLLNGQQYLQMRHEAKANDHSAILPTDNDINGAWDTTRNTNWQKELIGGYGHIANAQLGISGGSQQMQYRISGGYNYSGNLEQLLGGSDRSANMHVSLSSSTADNKFTISFTGGYLYDLNTMPQADLTGDIIEAPDAPALYTSTGALNFQNNTFFNPLVAKNNINRSPSNNLMSSVVLSYKPIPDLEIKLTSGYNRQEVNEFLGSPSTVYPPYYNVNFASSNFTYNTNYAWSLEPQINYSKKISKGKLLATIGSSLQTENSTTLETQVTGYSSDLLLSSPSAGTSTTTLVPYSVSPRKFSAVFGRLAYSWEDKYNIDITGRDDGSSNFGENKQFHVFGAAGASWIFSEESFIKNNLPFLYFGKLRGSYGSTGRDEIPPYSYLSTYSSYGVAYSGSSGLIPTRLPNPDLSWETTKKAELSLELQFLKGRIDFETNFYRNRTSGFLAYNALSAVTGFPGLFQNLAGVVQNQGFDASLATVNIRNTNFTWSTTVLFTRDRNILASYPGLQTSPYASLYVIGQPVDIIHTYRFAGVNPQTGIYQFYTAGGAITNAPTTSDRTGLVNINPDFYGSVQNSFRYKQFSLSFMFRYVKQTGSNAFGNLGLLPPGLAANDNFNTIVLNRWQAPGQVTNIQRYGTSFSLLFAQEYATQSNYAYGDDSYIRLQNLSLAYQLPSRFASKIGVQGLQVFVQGDNLWTITGYNGIDPENQSASSLPPLRIMTAGLRLTL